MYKICIDARFWGVQHTGIGRYVENLIDNLPTDAGIEVVLILHPDQKDESKLARFTKYYARHHPYSVAAQFEMLWLLIQIRPDLLHVPHFTIPVLWPGKMVITIHDLIKHLSRGRETTTRNPLIYWLKYFGYLTIVRLAVSRASHILVPARYWQETLIEKYHLLPEKISVTYEGVTPEFFKIENLKFKFEMAKPFVVYTGNLYPHKNVPILIEAVKELKLNLAIVCARSVFEKRLPKSSYLHFLGQLTDREIVSLYHQAELFVFPSLIEGFGLPGLEAMAVGLPVIAARASCLPEIYGDAAMFFDPSSSDDLAEKIQLVMSGKKLRQDLITKGKLQVSKYSWTKMSNKTWEIYKLVLNSHAPVYSS